MMSKEEVMLGVSFLLVCYDISGRRASFPMAGSDNNNNNHVHTTIK